MRDYERPLADEMGQYCSYARTEGLGGREGQPVGQQRARHGGAQAVRDGMQRRQRRASQKPFLLRRLRALPGRPAGR